MNDDRWKYDFFFQSVRDNKAMGIARRLRGDVYSTTLSHDSL